MESYNLTSVLADDPLLDGERVVYTEDNTYCYERVRDNITIRYSQEFRDALLSHLKNLEET